MDLQEWGAIATIVEALATVVAFGLAFWTYKTDSKKNRFSIDQDIFKKVFCGENDLLVKLSKEVKEYLNSNENTQKVKNLLDEILESSAYFEFAKPQFYRELKNYVEEIYSLLWDVEDPDYLKKYITKKEHDKIFKNLITSMINLITDTMKGIKIHTVKHKKVRRIRKYRELMDKVCIDIADTDYASVNISDDNSELIITINSKENSTCIDSLEYYVLERKDGFHFGACNQLLAYIKVLLYDISSRSENEYVKKLCGKLTIKCKVLTDNKVNIIKITDINSIPPIKIESENEFQAYLFVINEKNTLNYMQISTKKDNVWKIVEN